MSDRLLVATQKGLFRLVRNDEAQWRIQDTWFLGDPVSLVLPLSDGKTLYAALNLGHFGCKLQRSRDSGTTWEEIASPSYPEKPEGLEDKDPVRGIEVPWSLQLIWSLAEGEADELWCGTLPGGLFHSTDGGDSWRLVRSLWDDPLRKKWMGGGYDFAGIHSLLVDPRDANHLTLGVSVGGVWTSKDRGKSWTLIGEGLRAAYAPPGLEGDKLAQDPHLITHCNAHPDRLWMQHHNGIFRSDDAGHHWVEINATPSSFGFCVAVHPSNPDMAWFIPAQKDEQRIPVDGRLVVTRTQDGGNQFEQLSEGLPQEPAYDLVYRHALDIDAQGNRLAFGSTTGSLWISEDQGNRWQAISNHLPPIRAVCFER